MAGTRPGHDEREFSASFSPHERSEMRGCFRENGLSR